MDAGRRRLSVWLGLGAATLLLACASLAIAAEEISRTEYRARVEPICKRNAEANSQILKGVRTKVKQGRLGAAGHQFLRAAAALKRALAELREVPKPAADKVRLEEWLGRVGDEATLLRKMGKALIDDNRPLAERLEARLYAEARLANSTVLGFEFQYCRFDPSKYGG